MFSQKYSRKQPVSDWTESEVAHWLKSRGLGRFSRIFRENHINGKSLLCMKSQTLDNFSVNTPSSRDKLQAAIHELRLFGVASPPDNKHCSTPGSTDKENTRGWSMHGRTNPLPGKARQRPQFQAVPQADNVCAKHRRSQRLREEKGSYSPNSKSRLRANRKKTAPLASSSAAAVGKKGVVKVYAEILKADVQYKALEIYTSTSSKELVKIVLDKYDCRTKDPNLYYIAMETGVKNKDSSLPISQIIVLEEDSCPLELQESHPEGETKFHLKMRSGGLIMVRTSILTSGADFKSLYVARNTSSAEVVRLVLAGYDTDETPDSFCLREGSSDFAVDRLLSDSECPLHVQAQWKTGEQRNFNLTRKVSSKVTKDNDSNRVANNKMLQRELHNRDRTIEALRQAIRLMQQGPRDQLGGRNFTAYSSAEISTDKYDVADGSGIVSKQNEIEENNIDNTPTKRGKQNPTEFRKKVKDFHQRNNALSNGNLAAVAVVQPRKRSKSTSSLNDIDDLDHVKAGSRRFNEPEEMCEKPLLSRKSSAESIEKELLRINSLQTQVHNIKPTEKKIRSDIWQGNNDKIGDDYTLYDVVQNKDLIAVRLVRLPGEGLGIELAQVVETRPSKNTREGRQQKTEVLYIVHDEHGENVVLNKSQSSSSVSERSLGFRPISSNSSPRPRSVSLELHREVSNSPNEQKPNNQSNEDVLHQKLKQNLIARLNLSSPSSSCPSRPNSANVHRPSNSPLPLRPSSALAHWRSAGSPAPGPGVRIVGVAEGSTAALSGHLKVDDVIVEVNGRCLLNSTLGETIATLRESQAVNMVVAREKPSEIIDPPSPFAVAEMNQEQENEESSPLEETKALTEKVRELHEKLNEMHEELKKKDKKINSLKHALEKKKTHSKANDKHKYAETVQVMV